MSESNPEANLRSQNQQALALLETWMSEPDDLGHKWWDAFEQDLQQHRFSLREVDEEIEVSLYPVIRAVALEIDREIMKSRDKYESLMEILHS